MLDLIVDNYFLVMEKLSVRIEDVEEEVIRDTNKRSLARINQLRKELIVLKRNIAPVRDLVASLIRSENNLIDELCLYPNFSLTSSKSLTTLARE